MVGLFGGTFDPIHIAHLRLAEEAREEFKLERVIFIPASIPPHKSGWKISSFQGRYEMVRLSIQGNPFFEISDVESDRSTASYSVDTVRRMKECYPELAFLLGADQLLEIRTWKDPRELFGLCRVIVFDRPGFNLGDLEKMGPEFRALNYLKARSGLYAISASDIRGRVRAGKSIRYLVPDLVYEYILNRGLYKGEEQ
jgi:nicotinate-nucleotide adenylyltransferase